MFHDDATLQSVEISGMKENKEALPVLHTSCNAAGTSLVSVGGMMLKGVSGTQVKLWSRVESKGARQM